MTVQVAVRLPDELAEALDSLVEAGEAESRTSVIVTAIRRELRRIQDEQDIAILRASSEPDNEIDAMHIHARSTQTDLDA
jgi:Arc/MetJ-type ribon-helix-helix transcriptional regulator